MKAHLEALGMRGSMGRKGNPYDNAYAESFFKTLKHKEVYAYEYETMEEYELQYARQGGQNLETHPST